MKIKYLVAFAILAAAFLCFAQPVLAEDNSARIAQLKAQLAQLIAQLNAMNGQQLSDVADQQWCHMFTKLLGTKNSGEEDVSFLHTALAKEGFSYAPDEGSVYSAGTSAAVKNFQLKYKISPASGYFGAKTRAKMNSLYGCNTAVAEQNGNIVAADPNNRINTHDILSPIGGYAVFYGEQWIKGATYKIEWSGGYYSRIGYFPAVSVTLYGPNGAQKTIVNNLENTSSICSIAQGKCSYNWTIGDDIAIGSGYYFKICATDTGYNQKVCYSGDSGNKYFSIISATEPMAVAITSPKLNDALTRGQQVSVTWTKQGAFPTTAGYIVNLLKNGQQAYELASSFRSSGMPRNDLTSARSQAYSATIPNAAVPDDDYSIQIKIMSADGLTELAKNQTGNLIIVGTYTSLPAISYPNGGESWTEGQNYTIRWSGGQTQSPVSIKLLDYKNVAYSYQEPIIAWSVDSIANTGTYNFALPINRASQGMQPGSKFKIKISDNSGHQTESKDFFAIQMPSEPYTDNPAFITVTSPKAGDVWNQLEPHNIAWTSSGIDRVYLSLVGYNNAGIQVNSSNLYFDSATRQRGSLTAVNGSYSMPAYAFATGSATKFKILVEKAETAGNRIKGYSDFFTILPYGGSQQIPSSVATTYPRPGSTLSRDQQVSIAWTKQGTFLANAGYIVNLLKGGAQVYELANSFKSSGAPRSDATVAGGQYYSITIPNTIAIGSDYKVEIKIMSADGQTVVASDQTDGNFSIIAESVYIPPSLYITSPRTGERIGQNQTINIAWNTSLQSSDTIGLALWDEGSNQNFSIATVPGDSTSYTWTVPLSQRTGSIYHITANGYRNGAWLCKNETGRFIITTPNPTVTLTLPSGNQFAPGHPFHVMYVSSNSNSLDTLKLSLWLESTNEYFPIATLTGSWTATTFGTLYSWTIPATQKAGEYRVVGIYSRNGVEVSRAQTGAFTISTPTSLNLQQAGLASISDALKNIAEQIKTLINK